ncbi:hypothetical protein [Paraliomyxa miuraensis]|uniref:hypothetical protein n=1 Tax=Paraliomyxa miuraensis TaxID=376150 RepID=UPI0022546D52|nr:hypothetical protein [Paraliomyxa miuraensis]MCX4240530.1 hypothetical protein [Paraliomyxa miuraensis]
MSSFLPTYLDPESFTQPANLDWIRNELAQDRLVIVRDAFHRELAEALHAELERASCWSVRRDYGKHHQVFHEVLGGEALTPGLQTLGEAWRSTATREWIEQLRGRRFVGTAQVEAMWLYPGHYVSAYAKPAGRSMSMYWDLTRDWDDEWGGNLVWLASGTVIRPSFNTLLLCSDVPGVDRYSITPVNPTARGRRFAVTFLRCEEIAADEDALDLDGGRHPLVAATEMAPIHIDDDILAMPGFREPGEATS